MRLGLFRPVGFIVWRLFGNEREKIGKKEQMRPGSSNSCTNEGERKPITDLLLKRKRDEF